MANPNPVVKTKSGTTITQPNGPEQPYAYGAFLSVARKAPVNPSYYFQKPNRKARRKQAKDDRTSGKQAQVALQAVIKRDIAKPARLLW